MTEANKLDNNEKLLIAPAVNANIITHQKV